MMLSVGEMDCDCLLTVEEIKESDNEEIKSETEETGNEVQSPTSSSVTVKTLQCQVKNIISIADLQSQASSVLQLRERVSATSVSRYRYECDVCRKSFKASDTLKEHRRVKHEHIVYACPACTLPLRSKSGFRRHVRQCQANSVVSDSQFPGRRRRKRVDGVQDRTNTTLNDRSYVGRHCIKVGLADLVDTCLVQSGTTTWCRARTIPEIAQQKSQKDDEHRRTTKSRENFKCVCPELEASLPEELRCEHCDRIFVYPKSLVTHLSKHADGTLDGIKSRGVTGDVYTCYFCNVTLSSESLVAAHMVAMHTETQCRTLCSRKPELVAHVCASHADNTESI